MRIITEISPIKIITNRLVQRETQKEDIPKLLEFLSHEKIMANQLSNNPAYIRQELLHMIDCGKHLPRYQYSLSVLDVASEKLIGHINLSTHPDNFTAIIGWEPDHKFWDGNQSVDPGEKAFAYLNNSVAQIGWDIAPHYWNQGYGTEAIEGAITFAFLCLNVRGVIAQCFNDNKASCRVMEKNKMVRQYLTLWQQQQLQECYQEARLIVSYGLQRTSWEKRSP